MKNMIKQFALVIALMVLSACSSNQSSIEYYLLPSNLQSMNTVICSQNCSYLVLKPIELADFLREVGIAYRLSNSRIINVDSKRWAGPLDSILSRSLITTFRKVNSNFYVISNGELKIESPWELNVKIDMFNGSFDGYAYLSGSWLLSKDGQIVKSGTINSKKALDDDGYEFLLKALDDIWVEEITKISNQISVKL